MSATLALAALVAGLAGGAHCAGMCGGIMAALAAAGGRRPVPLVWLLSYNAGRIASYVVAGALAGTLGHVGLAVRGSPVVHQVLFAVASLALVGSGLYLAGIPALVRPLEAAGGRLWRRVEPFSRPLLPVDSAARALGLGAVWGWLPCGMVYGALLLALGAGGAAGGALVMAAFGAGTLPTLLGLGWAARAGAGPLARPAVRRAAGVVVVALGIFGFVQLFAHTAGLAALCVVQLPG